MDFQALRNELVSDPADIGYATMTPEQVQSALSGNPQTITRLVPLADLQAYLMTVVPDGKSLPAWWLIKQAAASNVVAEMAYDLFNSRLQNLDTSLPTVQGLLDQLVLTGVLDQTTCDAIIAMATVEVSRGVALFGAVPSILEIQFARLD